MQFFESKKLDLQYSQDLLLNLDKRLELSQENKTIPTRPHFKLETYSHIYKTNETALVAFEKNKKISDIEKLCSCSNILNEDKSKEVLFYLNKFTKNLISVVPCIQYEFIEKNFDINTAFILNKANYFEYSKILIGII